MKTTYQILSMFAFTLLATSSLYSMQAFKSAIHWLIQPVDYNKQLLSAAQSANKELLLDALHKGASINIQNDNGETALFLACKHKHIQLIELLLAYGADPTIVTHFKQTPLHRLVTFSDIQEHLIHLILAHKANINAKNCGDYTALHLAARRGSVKLIQLLLDKGANPLIKDKSGKQACDYALERNTLSAAACLTDYRLNNLKQARAALVKLLSDRPLSLTDQNTQVKIIELPLDCPALIAMHVFPDKL